MVKIDQLIHAKWLITCEDRDHVLEDHALAIKDGKILAILPSKEAESSYHTSAKHHFSSHAILPGFINSHTHAAMNVFRGLADDLDLMDWLNNYIWPAEKQWVSQEMVYDASLLAIAEMIRCGTICFNDMYFFPEETAKAVELAGIRGHIGMTIIDVPTAWAKTPDEYFAKGLAFYENYKHHARIVPTLAPHSTYTVSHKNLEKVNQLANDHGLKINIHLQEDQAEINLSLENYHKRPLARLDEIGMVSPNLITVHMTQLNEDDLEILAKNRPHIVHCPESNMKLVNGLCPVEKLEEMGINVALGTDGAASNNDLDMIGEMRSAAFLGKIAANHPKAVSADTVLRMATHNGAKALGIDHITGSLKSGKSADFIAIDLNQLETQPVYHPLSQIIYAASRHQVTDVWVAGQRLLKDRQLQTLDEKELLNKAHRWRKRIRP